MIGKTTVLIVFFVKKLTNLFSTFYDFQKCPITMVYRARYKLFFEKSKFCQFLNFYQGKRKTYKLSRHWFLNSYMDFLFFSEKQSTIKNIIKTSYMMFFHSFGTKSKLKTSTNQQKKQTNEKIFYRTAQVLDYQQCDNL